MQYMAVIKVCYCVFVCVFELLYAHTTDIVFVG